MELDKFTAALQSFINTPLEKRVYEEGVTMLFRLNSNRILYRNLLLSRDDSLLEYELKKHLRYRLDGLTRRGVVLLDKKVTAAASASVYSPTAVGVKDDGKEPPVRYRGRRLDHDTLPEEIKDLYEGQAERYKKIRELHFTLKGMRGAKSCDRYEILKILGDLDRKYRDAWERYDHYDPSSDNAVKAKGSENTPPPANKTVKKRSPFQMAISRNLARLSGGIKTNLSEDELKDNIILSIKGMRETGEDLSEGQKERLLKYGINADNV